MKYNKVVSFDWNDEKAKKNKEKHGVRFTEAVTLWWDGNAVEIPDPDHSMTEERWIRLGLSSAGMVLVVVYCETTQDSKIRIISALKAMPNEEKQYFEMSVFL